MSNQPLQRKASPSNLPFTSFLGNTLTLLAKLVKHSVWARTYQRINLRGSRTHQRIQINDNKLTPALTANSKP